MMLQSLNEIYKTSESKMKHAIEALDANFNTIRTGRASTALLDKIEVDAYGTPMKLKEVASISTPDARTITVTPWDKNQLSAVERAIITADLGLNPQNDGKMLRIIIPPLTEERRKELVKVAHNMSEEGRVSIRNVRKHMRDNIQKLVKDKEISEDEGKTGEEKVQEITNKWIAKVDEHLKNKEKEIMEI